MHCHQPLKNLLYTDLTDCESLISGFLLDNVLVRIDGVIPMYSCDRVTRCLTISEYGVCVVVSLSKLRLGRIADIK